MIQVVDKQQRTVRIGLRTFRFVKPYLLYDLSGGFVIPKEKQGRLVWNISCVQVSYNQLKKAFTSSQTHP